MADLDRVLALARLPEVTLVTFGDLIRVPASRGTLAAERAAGADVRVVYSPRDAVRIAAEEPGRAGRVRRHRLRDHGADHGRGPARGARRRPRQLQPAEPAQDHAAAAARPARPGRDAHQRVPAAGARERDHRYRLLRVPGRATTASPGWSQASRRDDVLEALLMLVRLPGRGSPSSTRAPCGPRATWWRSACWSRCSSRATPTGAASASSPAPGCALREEFADVDAARRFAVDPGPSAGAGGLPLRRGPARRHRPGRVPAVRRALHARGPGRRLHGEQRGRLRGALPLQGDR